MKLLITDYQYEDIRQEGAIVREAGFELVDLERNSQGLTLEQAVETADVIIVQYTEITAALMERMQRCKAVIKYGIGVNNIDVEAATARGIYVCNVPDYGIDEVSNHAVAMLLTLHRKIPTVAKALRAGRWSYDDIVPIKRLAGSTLGLVGMGRIPTMVAAKMKGFGVEIIAYDPYISAQAAQQAEVRLVDFDTLCRQSDIISIHCALTSETRHMFNREAFAKMQPHMIIVNTARGPVIHEADLIEALQTGRIAAAGLDTFEVEPIEQENPLLSMDNVICTPHCAWYTEDAIGLVQKKAALEAVNIMQGNPPLNAVNRMQVDAAK